jgi:uncharacterized membrane protein YeiH
VVKWHPRRAPRHTKSGRGQKALASGFNPVMVALLGMLTGIGGGMVRDLLVAEIPTVLRADLHAIAALATGGRSRLCRCSWAPQSALVLLCIGTVLALALALLLVVLVAAAPHSLDRAMIVDVH